MQVTSTGGVLSPVAFKADPSGLRPLGMTTKESPYSTAEACPFKI